MIGVSSGDGTTAQYETGYDYEVGKPVEGTPTKITVRPNDAITMPSGASTEATGALESQGGTSTTPQTQGQLEPGNIDLNNRPVVRNSDGSISTVRSMSFEEDGREVLVPTVHPEGRIMGDEEAKQYYRDTGQHLGKFDTPQNATTYAEQLHTDQEKLYQRKIDEMVAAAPNFANSPVIDQMTATAERGREGNILPITASAAPAEKSILDYLFGSKAPPSELPAGMPPDMYPPETPIRYTNPRNSPYPTDEEVDVARKFDYAYGQSWEKFFNNESARVLGQHAVTYPIVKDKKGQLQFDTTKPQEGQFNKTGAGGMTTKQAIDAIDNPQLSKLVENLKDPKYDKVRPDIENAFAKSALAVNRSAVAQLGFDPNKTLVDLNKMSGIIGATASVGDYRMYVSSLREDPSTIVHESIHNGIRKLIDKNPELGKMIVDTGYSPYRLEEYMVRSIMYNIMGNPEMPDSYVNQIKAEGKIDLLTKNEGYQQIIFGKELFKKPEFKAILDAFEKAAQDTIGKRGKRSASLTDETPYEEKAGQQSAMMKLKNVPSNPGVEAEKIAGATAVARGGVGKVKLEKSNTEQDAYGTHYKYDIRNENGKKLASASLSVRSEGRDIYVNSIGGVKGPGTLGTTEMKDVVKQLKVEFPDAERLYGFRVSGVRGAQGSSATGGVNLKPRSQWKDPDALGIPRNPGPRHTVEAMSDAEFDRLISGMQNWRSAPNLSNNLGRTTTSRTISNDEVERALQAIDEALRNVR